MGQKEEGCVGRCYGRAGGVFGGIGRRGGVEGEGGEGDGGEVGEEVEGVWCDGQGGSEEGGVDSGCWKARWVRDVTMIVLEWPGR